MKANKINKIVFLIVASGGAAVLIWQGFLFKAAQDAIHSVLNDCA